jgi:hypothetical protein
MHRRLIHILLHATDLVQLQGAMHLTHLLIDLDALVLHLARLVGPIGCLGLSSRGHFQGWRVRVAVEHLLSARILRVQLIYLIEKWFTE